MPVAPGPGQRFRLHPIGSPSPEHVYDAELQAVVAQVSSELKVPVSLVTLVLARAQLFRAAVGLPLELAAANATGRSFSFCQFVVDRKEPLVVEDATLDPSLPQHLVREFGIRAYAGMPVSVDGNVVGALCAIDTQPRAFAEGDLVLLERLAERVSLRLGAIESLRRSREAQAVAGEPAFQESRNALFALTGLQYEARHAMASLQPVFSVLRSNTLDLRGKLQALRSLDDALTAFDDLEKVLIHMEASEFRLREQLLALEQLIAEPSRVTRVDTLVATAERLLHHEAKVHAGLRVQLDEAVAARQVRRAPFLPALVSTVRTVFEFRRPTSSSRSLGSSAPPGDVSPLVVRFAVDGNSVVTSIECDIHASDELEAIRARLEASTSVFEGTRFELRGFDVCMISAIAA
jgi:hypothetical protein